MESPSINVFDAAKHIKVSYAGMPEAYGTLTAMKLQTRVYDSPAWSRVRKDAPLFRAESRCGDRPGCCHLSQVY